MQYFNEQFNRWYAEHACFNQGFDTGQPLTYSEILERINAAAPKSLFGRASWQTPYVAMTLDALKKEISRMNEEYRLTHNGENLFVFGKRDGKTTVAYAKHWDNLPRLEEYSDYPNFYRELLQTCGFSDNSSTLNCLARKLVLDCIDGNPPDVSFLSDDVYSVESSTLRQLAQCCLTQQPLGLTILADGESEKITFLPRKLKEHLGGWYLYGVDARRKFTPRIIPANDILDVEPLHNSSRPPYVNCSYPDSEFFEYDIIRRGRESAEMIELQLQSGEDEEYFTAFPLHDSQRIHSGRILTIRYPLNDGLVSKILYYSDRFRVIAPEELKTMVEKEIRNIAEMLESEEYGSSQRPLSLNL